MDTQKTYPLHMWPEIYVDWVNNFLTPARFAEYYGITLDYAMNIIEVGRLTDNFSIVAPKVRPATDYEKAMSGRDTMPADSIPWHEKHNQDPLTGVFFVTLTRTTKNRPYV
jgi:hypothetical protein